MSDETTEQVADKYVDKSVDTGKVEADKVDTEPVKTEEPDKADAEPEIAEEGGEVIPPEKDGFGNRIKELTDKVRTQKQSSDAQLFEKDRIIESQQKELDSRPAVKDDAKTLEDFDFDEVKYRSYLDERTHEIATKAGESAGSKFQIQVSAEQVESSFRSRESAFESEVSDYADVVYGEISGKRSWAASNAMRDEIRLSEIGPEIAYHLAKNPEIASEISTLSDRETVKRMTLLESSIKSEKAKAGKSVSEAPPPTPKLPSGDAGLSKNIDDPDLSDAAFAKMRRKQIANR